MAPKAPSVSRRTVSSGLFCAQLDTPSDSSVLHLVVPPSTTLTLAVVNVAANSALEMCLDKDMREWTLVGSNFTGATDEDIEDVSYLTVPLGLKVRGPQEMFFSGSAHLVGSAEAALGGAGADLPPAPPVAVAAPAPAAAAAVPAPAAAAPAKGKTKKEKKAEAKRKQAEMSALVASNNPSADEPSSSKKAKGPAVSQVLVGSVKNREGGVKTKDIIIGAGAAPLTGRTVAINYT